MTHDLRIEKYGRFLRRLGSVKGDCLVQDSESSASRRKYMGKFMEIIGYPLVAT